MLTLPSKLLNLGLDLGGGGVNRRSRVTTMDRSAQCSRQCLCL